MKSFTIKYSKFIQLILLSEPYKNKFYDGLKCAVNEAGGKVIFFDTYVMYLAKKPI